MFDLSLIDFQHLDGPFSAVQRYDLALWSPCEWGCAGVVLQRREGLITAIQAILLVEMAMAARLKEAGGQQSGEKQAETEVHASMVVHPAVAIAL